MITIKINGFVIEVDSIKEAREFITQNVIKLAPTQVNPLSVPKKKHGAHYHWTEDEVRHII